MLEIYFDILYQNENNYLKKEYLPFKYKKLKMQIGKMIKHL